MIVSRVPDTRDVENGSHIGPVENGSQLQCQTKGCTSWLKGRTESDARAVGWAVWHGTTRGGVEAEAIYCPTHNSIAARGEDDEAAETGWDAECDNCYSKASIDWGGDFDGTQDSAEAWSDEHACEPSVTLIGPKKVAS